MSTFKTVSTATRGSSYTARPLSLPHFLYSFVDLFGDWRGIGLAGQLMRGGSFGLLGDIVIGIVGAFVGGYLFGLVGISAGAGLIDSVVTATVGAMVLLFLIRLVKRA